MLIVLQIFHLLWCIEASTLLIDSPNISKTAQVQGSLNHNHNTDGNYGNLTGQSANKFTSDPVAEIIFHLGHSLHLARREGEKNPLRSL